MCKAVNGFEQLSFIFLECSSVLYATPVRNAFLSCTYVMFFSDDVLGKHIGPSSIIFDTPVSVQVVFSPST